MVLVFLGSAVIGGTSGAGRHSLDATRDEVAEYVTDADAARVWSGEYVAALGYLVFLLFAAVLWRRLRDGDGWVARAAFGAAALYVALSLAGTAALAPVLNRADVAEDVAASFLDLRSVLFALAFLALAGWLLATGVRALATGALPRWLGWAAVALAVLQFAMTPLAAYDPGFTGIPTFGAFLWIAVVSGWTALRGREAAAAAAA